MRKDYPKWTCEPCAMIHSSNKKKSVICWHYGKCDVCQKNAVVTEPRDFGHFPNWFKKGK